MFGQDPVCSEGTSRPGTTAGRPAWPEPRGQWKGRKRRGGEGHGEASAGRRA